MRAAVHHDYGPPQEVIRVEEVADPGPGERDVLVGVRAAGVNWADWSMTVGQPYLMRAGYGLRRPRNVIRGTDVAGTILQVGARVRSHHVGDEVFGWCTRSFAGLARVREDRLVSKPAGITFAQAAGIPMAGCVALQALRDIGKVAPGSRVLVNGASGGIGSFAVQIARSFGATVTGVCSTPNLDFVRSLGAEAVIDYTREDFTAGTGRYDLILDMADDKPLGDRRRMLTPGGVLIPNNGEGGPWFGSIGRILTAWAMSPFVRQRLRPFLSMARRDDLLALTDLIERGELVPAVGRTFTLDETGAAIAVAGSGHARGKVVITVADGPGPGG